MKWRGDSWKIIYYKILFKLHNILLKESYFSKMMTDIAKEEDNQTPVSEKFTYTSLFDTIPNNPTFTV